jgi:hypothetical protein
MGSIEILLDRVRAAIGQLVRSPSDLSDIDVLKSQIELRQRVLREIEAIHCRLKPLDLLRRPPPEPRAPKFVSARVGRARNLYTSDGRRAARVRAQTRLGQIN